MWKFLAGLFSYVWYNLKNLRFFLAFLIIWRLFIVWVLWLLPWLSLCWIYIPYFQQSCTHLQIRPWIVVFCVVFRIAWEFPDANHYLVIFEPTLFLFKPLPSPMEYFCCWFIVFYTLSCPTDESMCVTSEPYRPHFLHYWSNDHFSLLSQELYLVLKDLDGNFLVFLPED